MFMLSWTIAWVDSRMGEFKGHCLGGLIIVFMLSWTISGINSRLD